MTRDALVTEQAKEVTELMVRFPLGLHTEQPLHFTDIHDYGSVMLASGYMGRDLPDRLPPFARWPAFPASDYSGGSDADQGHWRAARLGIPRPASHVHDDGLCEVV
jgi:hypothetical protein